MTTIGAAVVPNATLTEFPSGVPITGCAPGDLILVAHAGFVPGVIRFGQRLRYRGALRKYAWCNHAAILIDQTQLVEQTAKGGVVTTVADYTYEDVVLVHPDHSHAEALDVAAFATWTLGIRYGWLTIAGLAFDLLTGCRFSVGSGLRMICSAASARALEHGGPFIPDRDPTSVMPADLARYFNAALSGG